MQSSNRIAIIGAGNVGASIAYAIVNQEFANEVLIIDIAESLARAQVLDLQDGSTFTKGTRVSYAEYQDLTDGDIVVISCGVARKEGQSRLDVLTINAKIIRDVIGKIKATGKKVYITMVTNPVDVLTYIAITEAGMPQGMVFGSGTNLDSGRLRKALAYEFKVNPAIIDASIIGEHGDTSLPVLSSANIGGIALNKFANINEDFYQSISDKVREEGAKIIAGKQATFYGIGASVARIARAIIRDEAVILPLSVLLNGEFGLQEVCFSIPVKLSSAGEQRIPELTLNDYEAEMLKKSAEFVKSNIKSIL